MYIFKLLKVKMEKKAIHKSNNIYTYKHIYMFLLAIRILASLSIIDFCVLVVLLDYI